MTSEISKRTSEGQISDVNNYINNHVKPNDYYTQIYYKKSVENGRETVKGAFMSVGRNVKPNVPDSVDNRIYYTNNTIDRTINKIPYDNSNLIKMVFIVFLVAFVFFVIIDFYSIYSQLKKENEIERQKLIREYDANQCSKITTDDGPELNRFCMEKKKKIENLSVLFHVAIIKYIKSIFSHSFSNLSLFNTVLFLVATLFLIKLITR